MNQPRVKPQLRQRLVDLLTRLYSGDQEPLADRLLTRFAHLPDEGGPAPLTARDCMLVTYADSVGEPLVPPLQILGRFLREHLTDCFNSVHVLPFFPWSSDDGFAVVNFRMVDPQYGSWADIEDLGRDFRPMIDLVINHCSRENLWFADFISDRAPGRDFFLTIDSTMDLSKVVRPRNTPLASQIHTYAGVKQVWTTFSEDQIDLNFRNPLVLEKMVDILARYIEHGARYIRLDAVAYLWKQPGTTCLHLPETHAVVKALRVLLESTGQDVRLITETNVPHEENVSYFGNNDEAHLVYQFSLAPLLLYSYVFEDPSYLKDWAAHLSAPPGDATYLNFIASHDGIGLRPLEGLIPPERVNELVERMHERGGYVTLRKVGEDEEKPYEINISLFSAFGGTLDNLPAYLAAHALLLSFQGVPAIYIHSLLASTNNHKGVEQTGRTRSINRGYWRVDHLEDRLKDPYSPQHNVLEAFKTMLKRRASIRAFAPSAEQWVVRSPDKSFAMMRECLADGGGSRQRVLVLANFASEAQQLFFNSEVLPQGEYLDLLAGHRLPVDPALKLGPFQVVWLDVSHLA